jgi:hypothetical protein
MPRHGRAAQKENGKGSRLHGVRGEAVHLALSAEPIQVTQIIKADPRIERFVCNFPQVLANSLMPIANEIARRLK